MYFNEFDPFAAAWLRNLYPDATVDERTIHDVQAKDLEGHERTHFFGGIGGWQLALDLAGWTGPVWTGSCPCQPYSSAGKRAGDDDKRNLWPEMFRLIRECRPPVIFGEQVASAIRHGWLDGISRDLEGEDYAVGAHVLGAHSVGAAHIRQRLFWVAISAKARLPPGTSRDAGRAEGKKQDKRRLLQFSGGSEQIDDNDSRMADTEHVRRKSLAKQRSASLLSEMDGEAKSQQSACAIRPASAKCVALGDTSEPASERQPRSILGAEAPSGGERLANGYIPIGFTDASGRLDSVAVKCRDGKFRRLSVEPGDAPLAHGVPCRKSDPRLGPLVAELAKLGYNPKDSQRIISEARRNRTGRLAGYGNAIVPQLAAEFIRCVMEILAER